MKKKLLSGLLAFALLFSSAAALPEGVFETSSTITASAVGEKWDEQFGKWYSGNIDGEYYGTVDYYYEAKNDGYISFEAKSEGGDQGGWEFLIMNDYENKMCYTVELSASTKDYANTSNIGISKGQKIIVRAKNRTNGIRVPTTDFSLRLNFTKASNWETEFNNSFETANKLAIGKTVHATMCYNYDSDHDYFKVNAPVAGKYTLTFGRPEYSRGSGWYIYQYNNYCEQTARFAVGSGSTRPVTTQVDLNKGVNYFMVMEQLSYNKTSAEYTLNLSCGFADNDVKAVLNKTQFKYTGSAIKPTATVTCNGVKLKAGTDYTITYKNNVDPGTATAVITGKGYYTGTVTKKFLIIPRTVSDIKIKRIAGTNRYDTAALISKEMNKSGTGTVIIATGMDYHDALVAVPLANAYNAPLLLTTDKQVTKQTETELKRLKAKKVIIVSTNGAVGSKVKAALAKYDPTMISGKTCFETATKVAKALQTKTKKAPDTIFFATDSAFADALSASPVAAIKNAPIIYLKNKGSIDSATAAYLKSVKGKVKNAYIIGGDGVISDAMMKNVASALGLKSGKTVVRVAGANRYETCVAVNNKFKSVVSSDGICVAKGLDFPDALAGGVYAAKTKQALFLADGKKLQDVQSRYLKGKNASKITVFGGTGAVPDELVKLIAQASV